MKHLLIFILTLMLSSSINAQIGGISGSKLRSYCVDVVDHHKIEFEPVFYYGQSRKHWDNESELEDTFSTSDSINRFSGVGMRITYGLFDKLEIGVFVPMDMKTGLFGARYVLMQKKRFGLALIGGVNIPMGDGTFNRGYRTEDNTIQAGIGGVFSYQKGENFSLDFNLEYDRFLKEPASTKTGSVYTSLDAGYYVFKHQLQLIGSVGFEHSHLENGLNQTRLMIYPGVTIETGKRYIIVVAAPFDVYGRNVNKTFGFSVALTLTIG
jgi:hypothetical protein